MTAAGQVVVVKIGGSVLVEPHGWTDAVSCVKRRRAGGARVIVVVSATHGTTEELLGQARARSSAPSDRLVARLLSAGEESSAALLGIALEEAGVPCAVRGADWLDLAVTGDRLDATPLGVDADRVAARVERSGVLMVPGFVGRHVDGGPALLGRGGSDLTAVFLASRLGARCWLVKDVDGLFFSDPRASASPPARYMRASWETVIERGAELVQAKAVRAAERLGVELYVCGLSDVQTAVGSGPDVLEPTDRVRTGTTRAREAAS